MNIVKKPQIWNIAIIRIIVFFGPVCLSKTFYTFENEALDVKIGIQ